MANPRRMFALMISLILLMSLLTGCWDRTETNDIAFVLSSSVDLEDDGRYRVAYMLPLPGSMGGASGGGGGTSGGKSYYIDSEVGSTIRDATDKLQMRMSRRLFLAHRRTIIIGEKLAKAGIGLLFDIVPRTPDSRLTSFLIVSKGKGYDLLNAGPKFERFPAEAIRELTKMRQSIPTSTKDIGIALSFKSDPIVAFMEIKESEASKQSSKEIQLSGYGQFKGDRMVGIYKEQEAHGLMWLKDKVKQHLLTFPLESGKEISILVTKGHAEITPEVQNDKIIFRVTLEAVGTIREDASNQDLTETQNINKVERKFAEQVNKSVQAAIKQMQTKNTDSAQLGLLVWRSYPDLWKRQLENKWSELFKQAEFQITVDASISGTGLINQNVLKDGM